MGEKVLKVYATNVEEGVREGEGIGSS